jgi:hypothetical protein
VGVGRLFKFFQEMGDYVNPDDGVSNAGYHHVIVWSGGILGTLFAVVLSGFIFRGGPGHKPLPPKVLLAPLIFFAMGAVFRSATACTFAPSRFLQGPAGRKWMKLIGTESIVTARVVCSIFTLIFLSFLGLMAWAVWSDIQRGML